MKLLQSALAACILVGSMALAQEPNKCGCSKPKPTPPAQVMKPATQKSACAAPAPKDGQKACEQKPRA